MKRCPHSEQANGFSPATQKAKLNKSKYAILGIDIQNFVKVTYFLYTKSSIINLVIGVVYKKQN